MSIVVGQGTHRYEWIEDWGRLPTGIQYGYTHGVVVDSIDRVYVHNQSKHAVIVFDPDGNYLSSWGESFADSAHGLYISREGEEEFLYLSAPDRHEVVKTTLDGREVMRLGLPPRPDLYESEAAYKPTDACVAPNGDIYVCDGYGKSWVHQYGADGAYIRSWGGKGSAPGQLDCPHGIWIDTRGKEPSVYVADRRNRRLHIFSLDGTFQRFVTEEIDFPCCFYQHDMELYIPDLHSRVSVLDANDRLIAHIGSDAEAWQREGWPRRPEREWQVGKFVAPHAVCVDSRGDLYVAEWVPTGRVTKLRKIR